jgi:hypothetical protein
MPRFYYYVVLSGGLWVLRAGDQVVANFSTQAEAVAEGARRARALWEQQSRPSGLRIQGRDGLWQDERTYGNDPYPPRG